MNVDDVLKQIAAKRKTSALENVNLPLRKIEDICRDTVVTIASGEENNLHIIRTELGVVLSNVPAKKFEPGSKDNTLQRLLSVLRERIGISDLTSTSIVTKTKEEIKTLTKGIAAAKTKRDKERERLESSTDGWNHRADAYVREFSKNNQEKTMGVESDWQTILAKVRESGSGQVPVMLAGGEGATVRLNMAKQHGSVDGSDSMYTRAKHWDEQQAHMKNVHWRLRNAVADVTIDAKNKIETTFNNTVTALKTNSVVRVNKFISQDSAVQNAFDRPLAYEAETLQKDLQLRGVVFHHVLDACAKESATVDAKHRMSLKAALSKI